jgi:hypothetical protein
MGLKSLVTGLELGWAAAEAADFDRDDRCLVEA